MRDLALDSLSVGLFACDELVSELDELVWDLVFGFDDEGCCEVFGLFVFLYFVGITVFVLAETMKSFSENCVVAGFVTVFVIVDCTILEKVSSGFCSTILLASMYVMLFVTLILIISFSFFQTSHILDLDR